MLDKFIIWHDNCGIQYKIYWMNLMSSQNLEIYKLAHEIVIEIHNITLTKIPKFEMYEEGNQIRRSSKSTKSNIVEGYGRRSYKNDFIRFLVYALSSNDETIDHLRNLYETGSLSDNMIYTNLNQKLIILGKQLNKFIDAVEKSHRSCK
jgi:four helix bundle protein